MAIIKQDYGSIGGGTKCSSGYYSANTVPRTMVTKDDTTGEVFKPKKIICTFHYQVSSTNMTCIYDESQSPTSYERRYDANTANYPLPRVGDYTGLDTITETGFTLWDSGQPLLDFYYVAVG